MSVQSASLIDALFAAGRAEAWLGTDPEPVEMFVMYAYDLRAER